MLFLRQNKKWAPSSLVQLELLWWDRRCSPRAVKVNMGLCMVGHGQDLQVEGRAPAVLIPGTWLPVLAGSLSSYPPTSVKMSFRTVHLLCGCFETSPSVITVSSDKAVGVRLQFEN